MKTGIIFPSYSAETVFSALSGAWTAAYPLANVGDVIRPSNLARAAATGFRAIGGVLPQTRSIQAFALIGHNYLAGAATARLRFFSGVGNDPVADAATIVYDSLAQLIWPGGAVGLEGYRSIRPFILPAAVNARSFYISIDSLGVPLELQAIELGAFWSWPNVGYGRELGVQPADRRIGLAGGASWAPAAPSGPRIVRGQINMMAVTESSTTGMDAQKGLDIQKPFVWAEDYDDASTWARKCLLVRNEEVPPAVGALYRRDRFPIRLIEHLR